MSDFDTGFLLSLSLLLGLVYVFREAQYRSGLARRYLVHNLLTIWGIAFVLVNGYLMFENDTITTLSIFSFFIIRFSWGLFISYVNKNVLKDGMIIGSYDIGGIMAGFAFLAIPTGLMAGIRLLNANRGWVEALLFVLCAIYLVYFQKLTESKIMISDIGVLAGEKCIRWSKVSEYVFIEGDKDKDQLIVRYKQWFPYWNMRQVDIPAQKRHEVETCLVENTSRTRPLA